MYSTGVRVDQGQFSRDLVGTVVGDFLYIATQLSDRQWGLIMTHCGDNKGSPVPMTQSVLVNRRAMYEQSSPTKESESEADDEWET